MRFIDSKPKVENTINDLPLNGTKQFHDLFIVFVASVESLSDGFVHFVPRRRDDVVQANRASFVATPTAELSKQEETLLGNILDWSLDTSCSGYEGDQEEESEGEKDGDCEF